MESSQFVIKYRPKYQHLNSWYADYVAMEAYVDYQSEESILKTADSAQIPFVQKTFDQRLITSYNSGTQTFTSTGANWVTNQFRWFTLVDNFNNRYKIKSNTADTITLVPSTEFTYPGNPALSTSFKINLPMFEIGDEFDMYAFKVFESSPYRALTDNDLVFVGQVKSISDQYRDDEIQTIIKLENITEVLFKSFNNPKLTKAGSFGTFIEKIRDYIIEWVKITNQNMVTIEWDTGNPTLKRDGVTAFPTVEYFTDYKSNYEIIYDLCQDKYTSDGEYYFYIQPIISTVTGQPAYKFVLRPKQLTTTTSLVEGVDFKLVSRVKDKGDIVTFLIIRCGRDMYNKNITTYVVGDLKNGHLGKPIALNFAGDIMNFEKTADPSKFDDETPTGNPVPLMPTSLKAGTGNYTTAYAVTAQEAAIYPSKLITGTFTATTEAEYREWVRWLTRAKAQIAGTQFLLQNNSIKNKIQIIFYNTPASAVPGTLDNLTINSIGWTTGGIGSFNYTKKVRQTNRTVNVTENGILTTITYEEDWELTA